MISLEIIEDSLHFTRRSRLTTVKVVMPLARWREVLTHRMASRNASSARAIPGKRLRAASKADPCVPQVWTENCPGMAGRQPLSRRKARLATLVWLAAAACLRAAHWCLENLNVHKEHMNYLLDPITHVTAVITMTDEGWSNFCALRNHPAAHPDLKRLGQLADEALTASKPKLLHLGQWHLPYATVERSGNGWLKNALVQSVARCCRVSMATPNRKDGQASSLDEDRVTVAKLIGADPKHASPTEHQAVAIPLTAGGQGNFGPSSGWGQYRKQIPNEACLNRFRDENGYIKGFAPEET